MKGNLQFSLLTIGGLIVFVAVGCVGLTRASDGWSHLLFTIALLTPLFAVLRILFVRGAAQAFAVGFVVLCWGYLVLVEGPWIGKQIEPQMATTKLMKYLHPMLLKNVPAPSPPPGSGGMMGGYGGYESYGGDYGMDMDIYGGGYGTATGMGYAGPIITIGPTLSDLTRAGHALFALLLGLAGGVVARASYASGRRHSTHQQQPAGENA